VIQHGPDDYAAMCACRNGVCATIPIGRADLIVYELDLAHLAAALASALDLTPAYAPSDVTPNTVHVGLHYPHAGFRFSVYLSLEADPIELRDVGAILSSRNDRPFILLTPTRELWSDGLIFTIDDRQHELLALEDIVEMVEGELRGRSAGGQILARFYQTHVLEAVKARSPRPFLIPPGTRWPEVIIRVMSDTDRVLIHVGERQWTSDFREMGMVDGRTHDTDEQWKMLLELAENSGRKRCDSPGDAEQFKQTVRRLRKILSTLFPISGDPLPFDHAENAWQAAFDIAYLDDLSASR